MKLRATDCGFAHWCPGCERVHVFYVRKPAPGGFRWTYNGRESLPTFRPSYREETTDGVCHYRLSTGRLYYFPDTTHGLRGETIDLPDLPKVA